MSELRPVQIEKLSEAELRSYPVWGYVRGDKSGKIFIAPIKRTPVSSLNNKVVAAQLILANGNKVWSIVSNIDLENPDLTKHFIAFSILNNKKWFPLARYHDYDYDQRGPEQLATFLGLSVDDVYPFFYDISAHVKGNSQVLKGSIPKEPTIKLSRAEIIALAVPKVKLE